MKKINISDCNNLNEVIEKTGLNFIASPVSMVTESGLSVPKNKAIVREDTSQVLGVVGGRYTIIPNQEIFTALDQIVQHKKASYDLYTEFDGGKRCILTAKYGQAIEPKMGDIIENKISMFNSFDGGLLAGFRAHSLRLVCTNGMTRQVDKQAFTIRHTKSRDEKIKELFTIMGMADNHFSIFAREYKALTEKAIDHQTALKFLESLYNVDREQEVHQRTKNKLNSIMNLFDHGIGNSGQTYADLLNGITEYTDHYSVSDDDKREKSSIFGSGHSIKEKAFSLLTV